MSRYIFQHHIIKIIITSIIFIWILLHLIEQKNIIYKWFLQYIMNQYCFLLYLIISFLCYIYIDKYVGTLMLIIAFVFYNISKKENYETIPQTTLSFNVDNTINNLLDTQLGLDERFKSDDVIKKEILRQIKAQIEFDPYKSPLAKDVIYELYNKYYDNDIFVKLKNINDDSQKYIAAGNFNYLPKNDKVDYDLITYQNLNDNIQFGVNPIIDGLANKTRNIDKYL